MDFDATYQLLIIHSAFVKYFRNIQNTVGSALAIYKGLNKVCKSVRREVLSNVLIKFVIPMKLIVLRMCLNEMYNKVQIGKYLSDTYKTIFANKCTVY